MPRFIDEKGNTVELSADAAYLRKGLTPVGGAANYKIGEGIAADEAERIKYDTALEKGLAGLQGFGEGASFGLVQPSRILGGDAKKREQYNPGYKMAGVGLGIAATAVIPGGQAAGAGRLGTAGRALNFSTEVGLAAAQRVGGGAFARGVVSGAVQGGVESATYYAGSLLAGDPMAIEEALADGALSAGIGGGVGGFASYVANRANTRKMAADFIDDEAKRAASAWDPDAAYASEARTGAADSAYQKATAGREARRAAREAQDAAYKAAGKKPDPKDIIDDVMRRADEDVRSAEEEFFRTRSAQSRVDFEDEAVRGFDEDVRPAVDAAYERLGRRFADLDEELILLNAEMRIREGSMGRVKFDDPTGHAPAAAVTKGNEDMMAEMRAEYVAKYGEGPVTPSEAIKHRMNMGSDSAFDAYSGKTADEIDKMLFEKRGWGRGDREFIAKSSIEGAAKEAGVSAGIKTPPRTPPKQRKGADLREEAKGVWDELEGMSLSEADAVALKKLKAPFLSKPSREEMDSLIVQMNKMRKKYQTPVAIKTPAGGGAAPSIATPIGGGAAPSIGTPVGGMKTGNGMGRADDVYQEINYDDLMKRADDSEIGPRVDEYARQVREKYNRLNAEQIEISQAVEHISHYPGSRGVAFENERLPKEFSGSFVRGRSHLDNFNRIDFDRTTREYTHSYISDEIKALREHVAGSATKRFKLKNDDVGALLHDASMQYGSKIKVEDMQSVKARKDASIDRLDKAREARRAAEEAAAAGGAGAPPPADVPGAGAADDAVPPPRAEGPEYDPEFQQEYTDSYKRSMDDAMGSRGVDGAKYEEYLNQPVGYSDWAGAGNKNKEHFIKRVGARLGSSAVGKMFSQGAGWVVGGPMGWMMANNLLSKSEAMTRRQFIRRNRVIGAFLGIGATAGNAVRQSQVRLRNSSVDSPTGFKSAQERLAKMAASLDLFATESGDLIRDGSPEGADMLDSSMRRAVTFLVEAMPKNPTELEEWSPTPGEIRKFNNTVAAALNPYLSMERLGLGMGTAEEAKTLRTLYPGLVDSIINEVATNPDAMKKMPRQAKLGWTLLTGQPASSLLDPKFVTAAQARYRQKEAQDQRTPSPSSGSPGKNSGGTTAQRLTER